MDHLTGLSDLCAQKISTFVDNSVSVSLGRPISIEPVEAKTEILMKPALNTLEVDSDQKLDLIQFKNLLKKYDRNIPIKISLYRCDWITSKHIALIINYCPLLQEINLVGCSQIQIADVKKLETLCKHLKTINYKITNKVHFGPKTISIQTSGVNLGE